MKKYQATIWDANSETLLELMLPDWEIFAMFLIDNSTLNDQVYEIYRIILVKNI